MRIVKAKMGKVGELETRIIKIKPKVEKQKIEGHTALTKDWIITDIDIYLLENGEKGFVAEYIRVPRVKAVVYSIAGKRTGQDIPCIDSIFKDSLEGENKDELLKKCMEVIESKCGKIIEFDGKLTN